MTKRAFIVEDHAEIGEIYRFTLELVGYEAEQVVDGKKGLERLESQPGSFDLIILDMNLPQVSGHYIYKKVRSQREWDNTPILISTANTIVANALRPDLGPMDHLIVKPVRPSDLRKVLDDIMTRQTASTPSEDGRKDPDPADTVELEVPTDPTGDGDAAKSDPPPETPAPQPPPAASSDDKADTEPSRSSVTDSSNDPSRATS